MALIFVENRTFPFARELTRLAKVGGARRKVAVCWEDPAGQIMLVRSSLRFSFRRRRSPAPIWRATFGRRAPHCRLPLPVISATAPGVFAAGRVWCAKHLDPCPPRRTSKRATPPPSDGMISATSEPAASRTVPPLPKPFGTEAICSSGQRKRRLRPLPAGRATQGKGWSLRLRSGLRIQI